MTESTHETSILFPLRTNVALFKTPEGYLDLEERLKVAALLYDRLLLEGGLYIFQAAKTGSYDYHYPRTAISDEMAAKQREEYERISRDNPKAEFIVTLQISGSERIIPVVRGPTEAIYFAELQSLAANFNGREQPWVEWLDGDIDNASAAAEWIRSQDYNDRNTMNLGDEFGNDFVKSKLIHALNRDLALAAIFEATLSTDPLHLALMAKKTETAGFAPTIQNLVVQAGFPGVKEVPWNEIVGLRADPGMVEFRHVVDEIENEIALLPEVKDSDDLRDEITRRWLQRFAEVIAATRPSLKQVTSDSVKSLVLDFVPLPGLGTLTTIIGGTRDVRKARQSWLSVFMHLAR